MNNGYRSNNKNQQFSCVHPIRDQICLDDNAIDRRGRTTSLNGGSRHKEPQLLLVEIGSIEPFFLLPTSAKIYNGLPLTSS